MTIEKELKEKLDKTAQDTNIARVLYFRNGKKIYDSRESIPMITDKVMEMIDNARKNKEQKGNQSPSNTG